MFCPRSKRSSTEHGLDIEEVRLIGDLRIMHAKVDELYQVVSKLRQRHSESDVFKYADTSVLQENIQRVDEIYLWFVKIKEERDRSSDED